MYLAISLRNVGSGIAVCQGWVVLPDSGSPVNHPTHVPLEEFRLQSRDLSSRPGTLACGKERFATPDDPVRAEVVNAIETGQAITLELLYPDQVGRQRTISRFSLTPAHDTWLAGLTRHWYLLGRPPARDLILAAAQVILRDRDAAAERRAEARGEPAADTTPADAADGRSETQLSDRRPSEKRRGRGREIRRVPTALPDPG